MTNKVSHHTASYLYQRFHLSKRSTKKIYEKTPYSMTILSYICASIDASYSKTKKFQTSLSQSQIAKQTCMHRVQANKIIKLLIRKRLIKYLSTTKQIITLGITLHCSYWLQGQDVLLIATPPRCVANGYTSNSSNFTYKQIKKNKNVIKCTEVLDKESVTEKRSSSEVARKAIDFIKESIKIK